ncbi:hypothetical protein FE810_05485 [Thalassotalea litorea]|uniref:Uncharacterized protein n=1 Tax=Thalassotalea litorea TaxID=2020715 RepID=A0A5R9ILL9_9GAMM|nr:hypothetical protein [Thalassotalea litorea]TLU66172.1 hypothetical protein FE810_05485 [Thalassotalea litorea]
MMRSLCIGISLFISYCSVCFAVSEHDLTPSKLVMLPNGQIKALVTSDIESSKKVEKSLQQGETIKPSFSKPEMDKMMSKLEGDVIKLLEQSRL